MFKQLPEYNVGKSLLTHLGYTGEPSTAAPYLRALLAFASEMPGISPVYKGTSAALKELSQEEDDQQLELRFERLFAIGEQTHESVDILSALAAAIFVQQNALLARLEESGYPAEGKQLAAFAAGTALVAYRNRVALDYQYVDPRGIEGGTRTAHVASLPLDDIYVLPRLLPERDRETVREREKDVLKELLDNPDIALEKRARLEEEYAVLTGERWRPGTKTQDEGVGIAEVMQKVRQAVVIGSPGVGKSALIRYLARASALGAEAMQERLGLTEEITPIVLPLAAFADARSNRPLLTLRAFLDERMSERGGDALRVAVAEELNAGRAFVLLDGVDEVPDSHARAAIVQAVDRFMADHSANRCLVTSRPYGYIRLAGELAHFQLLNFSPAQVEDFVHRWQRAFECKQHPEAPYLKKAEEEANALLNEIRRSQKVAELATNPLMLVIISLIRYERARLPEERVQLYNRAVNTLMDTWNQWRSLPGKDVGGMLLPLDRLTRVWGAVAEWMRRSKPTGIVYRPELKRKLVTILEEKEFDEDTPEATAESYLKAAADRAGLLEERGFDIFAFWHPTFEEFLAAVELTTPTSKAIKELLPLRDDPRWREVILLAVGYVGIVQRDNDTATAIVEALAEAEPSPLEPLLHSHLRLAAACIADDVGVRRTLAQRIIVRLAEVIQIQPYKQFKDTFVNTVRSLPNLRCKPETISQLAQLAENENWQVRMEAARLYSNMAADNQEARSLCEKLLTDGDPDVRCHAALGLARAKDYRIEVWQALGYFPSILAHIEPTAREFFATLPEEAETSLRSFLAAEDPNVRLSVARLLQEMGRADEQVVHALLPLLTAEEPNVRLSAARMLQEMGRADEQVVQALLSLLADKSFSIRYGVDRWLEEMGQADEQVVQTLLSLLTAEDLDVRLSAATRLQQMGRADERVLEVLLLLLTAEDLGVRLSTARMLQEMGRADEQVVQALLSLLTAKGPNVRLNAARMLQEMGRADEQVVQALLPLLTAEEPNVRLSAATRLQEMGRADEQIVQALLPLLTAKEPNVRYSAARMLQQIGQADEQIVQILLSLLAAESPDVYLRAAQLFQEFWSSRSIVDVMAKILAPQSQTVSDACHKILTGQSITDADGEVLAEFVRPQAADNEEQRIVREQVFHWLWKMLEPRIV